MTTDQQQPGAEVALPSDAPKPPTIREQIQRMEPQFAMAVPRGVEGRQIVRDALTAVSKEPKLGQCLPASVLGGCMTVAQLGLRLGVLGHAWLIPFWNKNAEWQAPDGSVRKGAHEATLIIGYQGLIALAYRSGLVDRIGAQVVRENDEFDLVLGLDPDLQHKPVKGDRGAVVGYYATVKLRGAEKAMFHHMTKAEAELFRDMHALSKWGPWKDHFDDMAKKTCVRQLAKWMPMGTDLANAVAIDDTVRLDMSPTADVTHVSHHIERGSDVDDTVHVDLDDVPVDEPPTDGG